MANQSSTGLRNAMLATTSLAASLTGGSIKMYSGAPPASADAAASGTLLCTLKNAGVGLTFGAVADGVLPKEPAEVWSGVNAASGVATHYRHVAASDTGAESSTEARIQGVIGVAGADMNLTNVALVSGASQTLDFYTINLPTL